MPSWKFILGLNTNTCGQYTDADGIYINNKTTANKEIMNRIKNLTPRTSIELISCKSKNLWSGGTLYWTFNGLENKTYNVLGFAFDTICINEILTSLNKIFYYLSFTLMIYGLIKYKSDKSNYKVLLFVNILAINFIVYSLTEVQPRYIYLFEISIFILSSLGFEYLLKTQKAIVNKTRKSTSKLL